MIKLHIFSILLLINILLAPLTLAQESTQSAEIDPRLNELKREIASKAAKLKAEINKKLQNKAYVGTVETVIDDKNITITSNNGPRVITTTVDTIYRSQLPKSKTKVSLETIKQGDYLVALGDIDENTILTAKKIVILPSIPKKTIVWGQVASLDKDSLQVLDKKGNSTEFVLDDPTIRKGGKTVSLKTLAEDDLVIVTGLQDEDSLKVSSIFILPEKAPALPSATKSAEEAEEKDR